LALILIPFALGFEGALADQPQAVQPIPIGYAEFKRLSYSERRAQITKLPPDMQLQAYLDMLRETEPPDDDLAWLIAPGGRGLVEAVKKRLEIEKSDGRRADLIYLLWVIHYLGHMDLRQDQDLLGLLQRVVESMKDGTTKAVSAKAVAAIRSQTPGRGKGRP